MLTTERLTLTPIAATDRDDLALLTGHPEVGGKLKHGVLDDAATDLLLKDYLASWTSHGYGVFVMRLRANAAFVGLVGLWDHDDHLGIALRYAVMPAHRGRGLTEEAVPAVLAFAAQRGIDEIVAVTKADNAASRRILSNLGFDLLREEHRDGRNPIVVYGMALAVAS